MISLAIIFVMQLAILVRADSRPAFERSYEVCRVGVAQPLGNLGQRYPGIFQQSLSISESHALMHMRKGRPALRESTLERPRARADDRRCESETHS